MFSYTILITWILSNLILSIPTSCDMISKEFKYMAKITLTNLLYARTEHSHKLGVGSNETIVLIQGK